MSPAKKARTTGAPVLKTAMVVSVAPTSFEALALSTDVAAAFRLVKAHGFDGVEVAVRDPALVSARNIKELAADHGLDIAAIGTGQAWVEEGLSLTHADEYKRARALERMRRQLDLGAQLGARVIVGLIRGTAARKEDVPGSLVLLADALADLGAYAQEAGAPGLLLEAINRYETRLINSVAEAADFLDRIGDPRLLVLADTFHMNIEERDLAEALKRAGSRLSHVHFADSNRRAPGLGHLAFGPVLRALRAMKYSGYASAEVLPEPTAQDAVRLTAEFFRVASGREKAAARPRQKKSKR